MIIIFLTLLNQEQIFKFNAFDVINTITFVLHKNIMNKKNLKKIRNEKFFYVFLNSKIVIFRKFHYVVLKHEKFIDKLIMIAIDEFHIIKR